MTTVRVSGNVVYIDGKPHEIQDRFGNMIICKDGTIVTLTATGASGGCTVTQAK